MMSWSGMMIRSPHFRESTSMGLPPAYPDVLVLRRLYITAVSFTCPVLHTLLFLDLSRAIIVPDHFLNPVRLCKDNSIREMRYSSPFSRILRSFDLAET